MNPSKKKLIQKGVFKDLWSQSFPFYIFLLIFMPLMGIQFCMQYLLTSYLGFLDLRCPLFQIEGNTN